MLNINKRFSIAIITLLTLFSLGFAFYAEFVSKVEPCPLCIMERIIIFAIFILSLVYLIHNPKSCIWNYIYCVPLALLAFLGIGVASRHLWLMNLPPELQPLSCGMPLAVLYKRIPLDSFLYTILQGDAECAKINWLVFGLKPPLAVIILLIIVVALIVFSFLNKPKYNTKWN